MRELMKNSEEIKKCPFCGSTPSIDDRDFCYPTSRTKKVWQAVCTVCTAMVLGSNKEDAINLWNKRYAK